MRINATVVAVSLVGALGVARAGSVDTTFSFGSRPGLAWSNMQGETLGIPENGVGGILQWSYAENPGGQPDLFATVTFSAASDVESPSEVVWIPAGQVELQKFEVTVFGSDKMGYQFDFYESLHITASGGYQSSVPPGQSATGILYATVEAWAGDLGLAILANPSLTYNEWLGPSEEPPWWEGQFMSHQFTISFPQETYSATAVAVPEPVTLILLSVGGLATLRRRFR